MTEPDRKVLEMLTDKHKGNRSLEKLRNRWEDNVRWDLKETDANTRYWVDLLQDRDY